MSFGVEKKWNFFTRQQKAGPNIGHLPHAIWGKKFIQKLISNIRFIHITTGGVTKLKKIKMQLEKVQHLNGRAQNWSSAYPWICLNILIPMWGQW